MPKDSVRCFLCDKGFVWSFDAKGQTNYPAEIFVCNNKYNKTVLILGEKSWMVSVVKLLLSMSYFRHFQSYQSTFFMVKSEGGH